MSTYFIGDIHGCYDELIALLRQIQFSIHHDTLWLTGDLVARGPDSLRVLRYVKSLGSNVRLVLGNHDLRLLAIYVGVSRNKPKDHLIELLRSPDVDELLDWLRMQPLLQIDEEKKIIMVHAGIIPYWDIQMAKKYAHDVETIIASNFYSVFFNETMFSNMSNNWNSKMSSLERLYFITNVFTRMRYCFPNGKKLDMHCKNRPDNAPPPLKPWFLIPGSLTKEYSIIFGHWASLDGKGTPKGIYALDTGCCWGGKLTCLHWEDKKYYVQPYNN